MAYGDVVTVGDLKEFLRDNLRVRVSLSEVERKYENPGRICVTVELLMKDEPISKDESWIDVPD